MQESHKILISDRLRDVLLEFEGESMVARLLLSKEVGEFVQDPISYISVSEQDASKISYLSTDRVEKLVNICGIVPQDSNKINDLFWTSSIRFHSRPGSFITKIFKNIPPKEIEKFSNLYRTNVNKPKFTLKVVSGSSIREYYNFEIYSGAGSLGNSCMKHEGCQKFFNIYTENKDVVSMLVMLNDDGLLMGRALLWDFESYKIMDRIYTIFDEELAFYFKKWATDNGYLYKSEQNWFNTLSFESLGNKKQEIKLDIKLKNLDFRLFPYVDTFKWINLETGTLHNYIPKVEDKFSIKTLSSSDGGRLEWDYIVFDYIDKVHRYRNECAPVTYINVENTTNEKYLWTQQCNMEYSDINNQWILRSDSYFNSDVDDYVFNSENDKLNNAPAIEERRKLILERRERRQREEEKRETQSRNRILRGLEQQLTDEQMQVLRTYTNIPVSVVSGLGSPISPVTTPVSEVDQTIDDMMINFGVDLQWDQLIEEASDQIVSDQIVSPVPFQPEPHSESDNTWPRINIGRNTRVHTQSFDPSDTFTF